MARPSTEIIEKYNVIEQFQSCGIKTVINLQRPGEHASCGNPLEQESGFTYLPEAFMEAEIYFYNFGWKDYGVASLTTILDMVKVMSFALQEGKVAIHCHAGLGRTGVLIACYLIFATRMTADQAMLFVRAKRPNAIQTRVQLMCIREFSQFLNPLHNVFSCCDPKAHAVTLSQYLIRQQHLLHGYEARHLKHVPKIVQLVCKVLLDLVENRQVVEKKVEDVPDLSAEIEKTVSQFSTEQLDKVLASEIETGDSLAHSVTTPACYGGHDSVLTSEQEFDPLWKRRNVEYLQPLSHLKKRLSYSDSDLKKAEILLEQGETPWTEPAELSFLSKINAHLRVKDCFENQDLTPLAQSKKESSAKAAFFFWSHSKVGSIEAPREGSPLFHRRKLPKEMQRSRTFSLGCFSPPGSDQSALKDSEFSMPIMTPRDSADCNSAAEDSRVQDDNRISKPQDTNCTSSKVTFYLECSATPEVVSQVAAGSELSLENRRLLAAKALACLSCDGAEEVEEKAIFWQKELKSREAAWDRICTERNPSVFSHLMWSWLEQLKEPAIPKEDVHMLASYSSDLESALYLLDKGQHQTVLCILKCVNNLRPIPADIEDAILERMIAAFTLVQKGSKEGPSVFNTLKPIFQHILTTIRK
ncbi:protein tyrosine phosphatase domain-containing protein 1 [Pyxicephalus adspersus]|uniref:protein tyrosine phosphatase domain-containing protein 1 n=1 Tax=Pyxicephalus adspersus TaxID=30357 RepID=UPI003B5B9471